MRKEVKEVLFSLLFLGLSFFLCDRLIGLAMKIGFNNLGNKANETSKMKYTLYDMEAECVILGSSRANHHYVSQILEDSLGMTVYNAGRDGHGVVYAAGLLAAITQRYIPKVIILEVGYDEFNGSWNNKINTLKPVVKDFPEIERIQCKVLGEKEKIKNKCYSYLYNSELLKIVVSYFRDNDKLKGYAPLYGKMSPVLLEKERECVDSCIVDEITKGILIDICNFCRDKGILLVACCSPTLIQYNYETPMSSFFKEMNVIFFNYTENSYYKNHIELFKDFTHMNHAGAEVFTKQFYLQLRSNYNYIN